MNLFDSIKPGSRVTIITAHGQQRSGRCVMKFPGHAVLNLGGRYGTPGIATADNVTKVTAPKQVTYL
jgi:hypothetical protein